MKATNSRHKDTPVTMSAFIMGILPTVFNGSRQRRRMLNRPMAAKVPAMVEMTVAKMAMSRVLDTASIIFCCETTPHTTAGRNPCQAALLLSLVEGEHDQNEDRRVQE